jgi:hypothetical protein
MATITAEAAQSLREVIGAEFSITSIADPSFKDQVADSTQKYVIKTKRKQFFLITGNPKHPSSVATAVEKLRRARDILDDKCRRALDEPLLSGRWDGVSYALWEYRLPLSSHKGLRFLQKRLLYPEVLAWLRRASCTTKVQCSSTDDLVERFLRPLQFMASNPRLGSEINKRAEQASKEIIHEQIEPINVLQHGDFWLGNILLRHTLVLISPFGSTFKIIDWVGALECGYPFYDFLRFSQSCGLSSGRVRRDLWKMSYELGCSPDYSMAYLLAGLGHLGLNPNYFPEDRFVVLCRSSVAHLDATLAQ